MLGPCSSVTVKSTSWVMGSDMIGNFRVCLLKEVVFSFLSVGGYKLHIDTVATKTRKAFRFSRAGTKLL